MTTEEKIKKRIAAMYQQIIDLQNERDTVLEHLVPLLLEMSGQAFDDLKDHIQKFYADKTQELNNRIAAWESL